MRISPGWMGSFYESDVATTTKREFEKEYPATMEDGLPFFRQLIAHHHEAMVAGDGAKVQARRTSRPGDVGALARWLCTDEARALE
jgi:hypothetical protein